MSRVHYCDDDNPVVYLWESVVSRAIKGRRGQGLLRELLEALEALPAKRLIPDSWCWDGNVCVLGCLDVHRETKRGIPWVDAEVLVALSREESEDDGQSPDEYAETRLRMSRALAWDLLERNDETYGLLSPEVRYERMVLWVRAQLQDQAL